MGASKVRVIREYHHIEDRQVNNISFHVVYGSISSEVITLLLLLVLRSKCTCIVKNLWSHL